MKFTNLSRTIIRTFHFSLLSDYPAGIQRQKAFSKWLLWRYALGNRQQATVDYKKFSVFIHVLTLIHTAIQEEFPKV